MKHIFKTATKTSVAIALAMLAILSMVNGSRAQNTAFIYQGRLDQSNSPANGPYDLRFALFDAESGGTPVGIPLVVTNISLSNGLFSVLLDFGSAPFNQSMKWLEVGVRKTSETAFLTLKSRQLLTAVPYATFAQNAAQGGANNPWTLGGITAFYTNGFVGIGTTNPRSPLEVHAPIGGQGVTLWGVAPAFYLSDPALGPQAELAYAGFAGAYSADAEVGDTVLRVDNGGLLLQNKFQQSGLTLRQGFVGIKAPTPTAPLEVHGDVRFGPTGFLVAASGDEKLRIVRGVVSFSGVAIQGSAYAVQRNGTGNYTVIFDPPFSTPPSIAGNALASFGAIFRIDEHSSSSANIRCFNSSGNLEDNAFSFIAIGTW